MGALAKAWKHGGTDRRCKSTAVAKVRHRPSPGIGKAQVDKAVGSLLHQLFIDARSEAIPAASTHSVRGSPTVGVGRPGGAAAGEGWAGCKRHQSTSPPVNSHVL